MASERDPKENSRDAQWLGIALSKIVAHDSFKALNKIGVQHYALNDDRRIMLKFRSQPHGSFTFQFTAPERNRLVSDLRSDDAVFVGLICGTDEVALLRQTEWLNLIDPWSELSQSVTVEIEPGHELHLSGSMGKPLVIPRDAFPKRLFE